MPQTASSVDSSGFDTVLLRIGAWGTVAVLALGTLVYAAQTDTGTARIQVALNQVLDTDTAIVVATPPPAPAGPSRTELAALETKIDRLTAERVRLEARLATLEHGLEDVTGSVRRQTDKVQSKPTVPSFVEPPVIPPISTLPRAPAVASIPAEAPALEPATESGPAAEAGPEETPLPPPRPRPAPHASAEFGVELGTAPDLEALRTRWSSIKANFGPLLVGLSPVGVKDKRPGSTQLRLMAGPLKSMAAARELCAKFVAANGYCWPTRVDATDVVQR